MAGGVRRWDPCPGNWVGGVGAHAKRISNCYRELRTPDDDTVVNLRLCQYMWNLWLNVGSMRRKLGEMRLRVDVRRVWKENLRLNKE